jgi:hypothetical protein
MEEQEKTEEQKKDEIIEMHKKMQDIINNLNQKRNNFIKNLQLDID